jgi:hypothetical protein
MTVDKDGKEDATFARPAYTKEALPDPVLSHGPQAPWQLGMFALGVNMRENLTCRHVKLGKIDQKDQALAVLIHESHGSMAQKDLIDQSLIHEIYEIHAKSS